MTATGHPAPALSGLGAAALLDRDHAAAVLGIALAGLAGLLFLARSCFTVFTIMIAGAVVFAVLWCTGTPARVWFAYAITWFLLLAGVPHAVVLLGGVEPGSDADVLEEMTGIPAFLWVLLFGTVGVGALVVGGRWPLR